MKRRDITSVIAQPEPGTREALNKKQLIITLFTREGDKGCKGNNRQRPCCGDKS